MTKHSSEIDYFIVPKHPVYIKIRNYISVLTPALVMIGSCLAMQLICSFVIMAAKSRNIKTDISKIAGTSLLYAVCGVAMIYCLWKLGVNTYPHFRSEIIKGKISAKRIFLSGIMLATYSIMVQSLISVYSDNVSAVVSTVTFHRVSELLLYIFAICIMAPVYEELMRVITIMNLQKICTGERKILITQAIIFALCHLSPSSVVVAIFGGYMLGGIYLKTNNIKINMFAHLAFNMFALIPYGDLGGLFFIIGLIAFIVSVKAFKR